MDNLSKILSEKTFVWSVLREDSALSDIKLHHFHFQAEGSGVSHILALSESTEIPLDENEKKLVTFILPHLAEGFRLNLLSNFYDSNKHPNSFRALYSKEGHILEQDDGYLPLLVSQGAALDQINASLFDIQDNVFTQFGLIFKVNKNENYQIVEACYLGTSFSVLSNKEKVVCYYIGQGLSNEVIASEMGTSRKTTENHLVKIYEKLGISSRALLVSKLNDEKNNFQLSVQ
ncbi:helix-turn-helix transcriptional regulator [Vibrio penaeicida]|uniref:HTH luxR-type domain-containing protein n=1 Tax=Vibrio penaeicida TaxID=104609 RepID=A0AAV5NUQ3_9VIBR|nr:LuxR C-terminal-related transcriptional regulator [Vibrio penaeicida]RTZ21660.1 response regulator transcription factor [Vibrio penaeicida]GLQ74381.1 hypothetical protein GCM10007932_37420 [Vibrio penaeicida]